MASSFPNSVDLFVPKINDVDDVLAEHVNDLQDATKAIEDYLLSQTPDQSQAPVSPGTGKVGQVLSWLANRIKAITGATNWWDSPAATQAALWAKFDPLTGHKHTGAAGDGPLLVPPGVILPYGGSTPPSDWLECNGAAVSRTAYAALFAAIGTTFGAGDGTTTFNLPDLRGEFIRGWDHDRGVDSGRVVGSWQADDFKSHVHTIKGFMSGDAANIGNITADLYFTVVPSNGGAVTTPGLAYDEVTVKVWNSGGPETRPRNVAAMFIIKY